MEVGTYTPFRPLTAHDSRVFEEAFGGIFGVHYIPYAVSTQVVHGINYRFLCTKSIVAPDPLTTIVIVTVHCVDGKVTRMDDMDATFNA